MISTPIGISIQSQPPTIYREKTNEESPNNSTISPEITEQTDLYNEYITNPYNDIKQISDKDATLYDPEEQKVLEVSPETRLLPQKSLSANVTPMHTHNKAQFGSTDNVNVKDSSIFNFSSYFGTVSEKGVTDFDALMSTQEG